MLRASGLGFKVQGFGDLDLKYGGAKARVAGTACSFGAMPTFTASLPVGFQA